MAKKVFIVRYISASKIILFVLAIFLVGAFDSVGGAEQEKPKPRPVKVEKVIKKSVRPYITLIGTAEPSMKSTAASEVQGLVIDFPVRAGQAVREGDILARVESTPLLHELKQAEAGLAEAEANYQNALADFETKEALFKTKAISSRDYDDIRFRVNALNQKIAALKAKIEPIHYQIDKCVIRAPYLGVITEEHTQKGQWLTRGGPVVTLVNLDPIRVSVPVPDRYIQSIKPGDRVQLDIEFVTKGKKITGRVSYIIPQGNEKARTFPVHVLVENRNNEIMPGMSAQVHFPTGEPYEALLIHKDAFSGNGEQDHVFVIRDGKAELVSVKKGRAYGSLVVTEGSLSAGEMVVVEGNERLRPGQEVEAIENNQK